MLSVAGELAGRNLVFVSPGSAHVIEGVDRRLFSLYSSTYGDRMHWLWRPEVVESSLSDALTGGGRDRRLAAQPELSTRN